MITPNWLGDSNASTLLADQELTRGIRGNVRTSGRADGEGPDQAGTNVPVLASLIDVGALVDVGH